MPVTRGQFRAICLNASLFLAFAPVLSMPVDVLAWTGRPVAYPAYAYGPPGSYRAPVMPAWAQPAAWQYPAYPVYPQYPAYAPPRHAAPRPAGRTPAPAAKRTPPSQAGTVPAAIEDLSLDPHKQRFFSSLLPLVTLENERLLGMRRVLTDLQTEYAAGTRLNQAQLKWLRELADDYRVEWR